MKPRFSMHSRYKWTVSVGPAPNQTIAISRLWRKGEVDRFTIPGTADPFHSLTDAAFAAAERLGYRAW